MKARFWVVCTKGRSLRDSLNERLASDRHRSDEAAKYQIYLKKERKLDRRHGWSWVESRNAARGVVRYRWNRQLRMLECWAVTRGGNRASQLMGEFIETLLDTHRRRIKHIHVDVR